MPSLRQIIVLGLASCLGTADLFAQAQKEDGPAKQIAHLPWDADVNTHAAPADAQIVVTAHYAKPGVVEDTDTSYISVHHSIVTIDKNGNMTVHTESQWRRSKCRDSIGGWCNGSGDLVEADKNGFKYHLYLTWQIDKESQKTFDEVFHCLWIKEQTFKRNGFTITITTKLK